MIIIWNSIGYLSLLLERSPINFPFYHGRIPFFRRSFPNSYHCIIGVPHEELKKKKIFLYQGKYEISYHHRTMMSLPIHKSNIEIRERKTTRISEVISCFFSFYYWLLLWFFFFVSSTHFLKSITNGFDKYVKSIILI